MHGCQDSSLLSPFGIAVCLPSYCLHVHALTLMHACCHGQVVAAARSLIQSGASSVLVTLSERGAVLVLNNGSTITQPALPVPGGVVVDGTAAGGVCGRAMMPDGLPVLMVCDMLVKPRGQLATGS